MPHVAQLTFRDGIDGDDAIAIVRTEGGKVALCLSLASNGDIEVGMDKATTLRLIEALGQAASSLD